MPACISEKNIFFPNEARKAKYRTFQVLRAHNVSKDSRAQLKVNIQFKVNKVKIQFPDV